MKKNNCKCLICGKEFYRSPVYIKRGVNKTCSMLCRGKVLSQEKGVNARGWKGGKYIDKRGYIHVREINHPYSTNGYILEHRLIIEKYINRYLEPIEVVDHKNGVKDDNRLENLQVFPSQSEHIKVEGKRGVYKDSHSNQKRNMMGRFI